MSEFLNTQDEPTVEIAKEETKAKKILTIVAWSAFGVSLLLLFTFVRFPRSKIEHSLQNLIATQLQQQGVQLSAQDTKLTLFPSISYEMEKITLFSEGSRQPVILDKLRISPRFRSLIKGQMGASFSTSIQNGSLEGIISGNQNHFTTKFKSQNFPLHSLLPLTGGLPIELRGNITSNGSLRGKTQDPSALNGLVNLTLTEVSLPGQSIMGMRIPQLDVSEGKLITQIKNGKAQVQTLILGTKGNVKDDIIATGEGFLQLGKTARASQIELLVSFELSEKIMNITPFLRTILQQGQLSSGGYRYQFKGSLAGPLIPTPVQ
jgi:type II secretion system protein N